MNRDTHFFQLVAGLFRQEFMRCDLSRAPASLPYFPKGCCNWASYMIGHYLKFERNMEPKEVIGTRQDETGSVSHSWLRVNQTIIDITSDQFSDSITPVIVGQLSYWHQNWEFLEENKILPIIQYDGIETPTQIKPSEVYEILAKPIRSQFA